MASALTVLLLCCWLAGQSGVSVEGSDPKPSISVSPGGVIPVGGKVTIRCWHQLKNMRILLYKAGAGNYLTYTDPAGSEAEFPITSARRDHGGSYTCRYSHRTDPPAYSEPSDPVQIIVADPSLPRPSISLSPTGVTTPGADVTIRCQGQHRDVRFFLHKAEDQNPQRHMDPAEDVAEFRIPSVGRQHGGSYSCSYWPRSEPFISSQPSDPMELVVADPSLPRPSISLSPTGVTAPGADVTIRCEGQRRDVRFFLHKAGDLNPQRHMDPAGATAEFRIPSVGQQHGGHYSCSYRPRSEPFVSSQPSDPVELVVRDASLPRPSISLSPTGVTAPGADVTIRCEGQRRDVRFFLHKAGDLNPQQQMDTAGNVSEFRIPSVGRQHGGRYSCSYRPRSEPFVSSLASDPVELVVRDPSLPRPSISLSPTGVPPTEADVTIRCQGQRRDLRFFLHKAGDLNPQRHMDPAEDVAEFRIPSVGRQDGGSYNCSYQPRSEPFISSLPSDPVELVVAEPTLPKPSISPSGNVSLGGSVSVRCQGLRPGVRFELNKGRRHVAHVDTERLAFVFPINNVQREQGGNYSCSHHHGSEPFTEWSDSVELVVRG